MLWRVLVSDGHVRAAKLRTVMPWWLAGAIIASALGLVGLLAIAPPTSREVSTERSQTYDQRRPMPEQATAQAVTRFFRALPPVELDAETRTRLAPAYEINRILPLITESLNQTGRLPEHIDFTDVNREGFWREPWDVTSLRAYRRGNLYLIGAIVSDEREIRAQRIARPPVRWLGVFRRVDGQWHGYTLRFDNAYLPPSPAVAIDPASVPVTMERLLPRRALAEHRDGS